MTCIGLIARPISFAAAALLLATAPPAASPAQASPALSKYAITSPTSQPIEIVKGADGNMWFTLQAASAVARITPGGEITEFRTPTLSFPTDITAGPDGRMWFGEGATGRIARIDADGRIREFVFDPTQSDIAAGITTGPDGAIWFTAAIGNRIWRFDLATRVFTSFALPTPGSFPGDIVTGSDGNLWFAIGSVGRIGRITLSGEITEFGADVLALPWALAPGPDGNVWFTERFGGRFGRITPQGEITFFSTPGGSFESLARGPGDTLLMTIFGNDSYASIAMDGSVRESPPLAGAAPTGIAMGPHCRIWMLGYGKNVVLRVGQDGAAGGSC